MTKIFTKDEVDDPAKSVEEGVLTHPSQWVLTSSTESERLSEFGLLRVERIRFECWVAYRDDCGLMDGCGQVQFETRQQAQSAADRHEQDGFAATDCPHDGHLWSNLTKFRPVVAGSRSSGRSKMIKPAHASNHMQCTYLGSANSSFRRAVP
jgi:hypothetical protein